MTGAQRSQHAQRHHQASRRLGISGLVNLVVAVVWLAMIPVALLTGLKSSVPFLVGISLWALFAAHLSAAYAARAGEAANQSAAAVHDQAAENDTREPSGIANL